MPSSFLSSYFRLVTSSLLNSHDDNYDSYRFGPLSKEQPDLSRRMPIRDYLHLKGLPSARWSREVLDAIREVLKNHPRFERLYNQLADDESRDILLKVLAFRALGHRKVKLPLSTPSYWNELRRIEALVKRTDSTPINSGNWQLHLLDLEAVGVPVQLYAVPIGPYPLFVLEQYRCRSHLADIAVEPGDYVIDAGACWGDTALYFAHRSRPDGRVFSYEFLPDNLRILRRNLALNPDLNDRIHIIERAAWDESDLTLSVQGAGPGARVSVDRNSRSDAGPRTLTIDDLTMQQNLPRVDFIKMDIEGAELPALRGAKQTIQRYKPKLAISVYHRLTDFFEIPEFLDSLRCGYHFFLRHYTIHAEETVLFAKANRR